MFATDTFPFQPDQLTRNQPTYAQLYSVGTDDPSAGAGHGAPRVAEIYTMSNFVDFLYTQEEIIAKINATLNIPLWTMEIADSKRRFTICSYKAMMTWLRTHTTKHIYRLLPANIPLHMYFDFDLSTKDLGAESHGKKSVNAAIAETCACMEIIFARERKDNPSFSRFDGAYTVSVAYGHKVDKESAHMVVHLSGHHMFAVQSDCFSLYGLIIHESKARHANLLDNPLFFQKPKGDEAGCILDGSIYYKYKNFRTVGSYKFKSRRADITGGLYPLCDNTIEKICEDPDCFYHAHHQFLDSDFLENDPGFIPRTRSGQVMVPLLLTMPSTANPNLRKNGALKRNIGSSSSAFSLITTGSKSPFSPKSLRLPSHGGSSLGRRENNNRALVEAMFPHNHLERERRLAAQYVVAIVQEVTGVRCDFNRFNAANESFNESFNIATEKMGCCYAYRLDNPTTTPEMRLEREHKSNHIFYSARLTLPLPTVFIGCWDPDCYPFYEALWDKDVQAKKKFCVLSLNVSGVSPEALAQYREAVTAYARAFTIPAALLSLK